MYQELAPWWPLLSSPEEYAEEAEFYRRTLLQAAEVTIDHVLELGSGGGNNASHLKRHFRLTLVDLSPEMLAVSRELNPECEHIQGDMRTVRFKREFDAVFVHDAITYMTTEKDVRQVLETALIHSRRGGAALFAPDYVRETFRPATSHGGNDDDHRGLRYLEWTWDPDPDDSTYMVDYALLLRDRDGAVRIEHDRHTEGLFSRAFWLSSLDEVGFEPLRVPFHHSEIAAGDLEVFVGRRRSR